MCIILQIDVFPFQCNQLSSGKIDRRLKVAEDGSPLLSTETQMDLNQYSNVNSSSSSSHSDLTSVSSLENSSQHNTQHYDPSEIDCPKKPFPCPVCGKCFGRISHVRRHQLLHTGDKPYQCEVCQERFTRIENRDRHMAVHTKMRPYSCSMCSKGFTQLNRLKVHMLIHTGDRPIECPTCNKRFKRIDHMRVHLRTHGIQPEKGHGPLWNRLSSNHMYSEEQIAINHKLEEIVPQDHKEDVAGGGNSKLFRCQQCSKTFSRRDHFNRHILVHSGAKPYECEVCSRCFSRKDNKYSHMANCLLRNLGIVIKQDFGGTLENTIESKMSEIRGQMGELMSRDDYLQFLDNKTEQVMEPLHPLRVNVNGSPDEKDEERSLSSPDSVGTLRIRALEELAENAQHVKEHSSTIQDDMSNDQEDNDDEGNDEEDYVDPSAFLSAHLSDVPENFPEFTTENQQFIGSTYPHPGTTAPRFQCDICNRNFVHKSHLVRHSMVHSGSKPYRCDQCEKSFNRKEHLQRHVIVHTGIKPFKCSWCEKSFYHLHQQLKHTQEEHNDETSANAEPGADDLNPTAGNDSMGAFMDSGE